MDCKSLMIGDWVKYLAIGDKEEFCEIVGISMEDDSCFCRFDDGIYDTSNATLYPIPLTAEILEKNGWSKEEIPARYQCGVYVQYISPNGRVIASHFDTNSKEWGVHLDNDHFSTVGYFECDYVHELQHALRLCGLNELADNFKV